MDGYRERFTLKSRNSCGFYVDNALSHKLNFEENMLRVHVIPQDNKSHDLESYFEQYSVEKEPLSMKINMRKTKLDLEKKIEVPKV